MPGKRLWVFCGYAVRTPAEKMEEGKIKRLLLVATGALMSPTTSFQGKVSLVSLTR